MATRHAALIFGLLWLIGIALRLPILAVPPVIPALRADLGLSGTEIGILTGLPIILFAVVATPGSLMVARLGAVATAIAGLFLTALASAGRGAAPESLGLLAATALMGAGVAITHPAIPVLVRDWLPRRIGLGTAVYTNGLIVGEILPVLLFPALFALVGDSWRALFVVWAVPIAAVAILALIMTRRERAAAGSVRTSGWPDWRDARVMRFGLILGSATTAYFVSNAFLPGHLVEAGRPDLVTPALTALNFGQLPASVVLIAFASRLERRVWPFIASGAVVLASIAGIVTTASAVTVVCAGTLGFAAGGAFALGLALPALLGAPDEVARLSAGMYTLSYGMAVVVSVAGGAVWDLAGGATWSFLPIALAALPGLLLAPALPFRRAQRGLNP